MNLSRRQVLHLAAGAAALSAVPRFAWAQTYPSRPIHLIIGFTPGAATDVIGRFFAKAAEPRLGQQIVVENRPGAGSRIAAQYVAHSARRFTSRATSRSTPGRTSLRRSSAARSPVGLPSRAPPG
jgi:tripartite-type tricarboxylate transporter receptor subunit TctC